MGLLHCLESLSSYWCNAVSLCSLCHDPQLLCHDPQLLCHDPQLLWLVTPGFAILPFRIFLHLAAHPDQSILAHLQQVSIVLFNASVPVFGKVA